MGLLDLAIGPKAMHSRGAVRLFPFAQGKKSHPVSQPDSQVEPDHYGLFIASGLWVAGCEWLALRRLSIPVTTANTLQLPVGGHDGATEEIKK